MKTCWPLFAAVLLLAGCETPTETAGKKAAEDEYVTVNVTGTNIPKRVRKSDIEKGTVPKDVQAQLVDKDIFVQQLMPGRVVEKGN
jgi:PBP1b-binding outer membrane lipoprotein LpoB